MKRMKYFFVIIVIFLLPNFTPPYGGSQAQEISTAKNKSYNIAQPINDLIPALDSLVAKTEGVAKQLKTW